MAETMLTFYTIIDIKYPQRTCLRIFVAEEFSKLFLQLSIFLIKNSRPT